MFLQRTWLIPTTGEVIAEAGTQVSRELADTIQNAAVPYVMIQTEERDVKVLSSMMVDLAYLCRLRSAGARYYRVSILSGT